MPLPWLAFIAALLPHGLALRDGFPDMSHLSANLSHVRGAVAEPDVHPVPTPLEACGTYGHGLPCPPRTSPSTSSKSLHVLDSDKHPPFSRGTIALAWAGELLHTAGPPRPHGYSVTLAPDRDALADDADAISLDRHLQVENHTPVRAPSSSVLYFNHTALHIPPFEYKDVMIVRRYIAVSHLVIPIEFHRGALDGYCDFERLPPYDAKRGRRLARRIASWYRTVGERIRDHRIRRARLTQLDEMVKSEECFKRRLEFLRVDIPEYALVICKWTCTTMPHRVASIAAHLAAAVTRRTFTTILRHNDTVIDAVTTRCKLTIYNAVRTPLEVFFELLPHAWFSAREGVRELMDLCFFLPLHLITTFFACAPTMLCFYALAPFWRKFKLYYGAAVAYEAAVLKTQALFVAENVAWTNARQLLDRPFPISRPVLRSSSDQARFSKTCRAVGSATERDVEYFRGQMELHSSPPTYREYILPIFLIGNAAALHLAHSIAAIVAAAIVTAVARFPYHVLRNVYDLFLQQQNNIFFWDYDDKCKPRTLVYSIIPFLGLLFTAIHYAICHLFQVNPVVVAAWLIVSSLHARFVAECFRTLRPCLFLAYLAWLPIATAASGEESMRCPSYDGTAMTWTAWYIAFTAWVAWKEPRLVDLLRQGAASCPTPSNWMSPTPTEVEEVEKWNMLNIRLYGSILMHMSEPLRVSLHTAANTDGCGAIEYLKKRYGAHSSGDRTEAAARMQRSFIDPRAPMSTDDLALQYNEMSQAVADLVTSGGSQPDGPYLISLLENALPASYAQVRQMVRYRRHTDFEDYYQDVLEQVKAEVRSTTQPAVGAFSFQRSEQPGTSRTERPGAPRGLGANPCFNCGSTQHTRDKCPNERVKCTHCGGSHISSLCPKGPGGPLRDSLSAAAKRALGRTVRKQKPASSAHTADAGTAATAAAPPTTAAFQVPDEAQLAAQFRAYRAGKAAAAAAALSSASSTAPPPAVHPVTSQTLSEPDEMEEFMSAVGRAGHYIAARREYHKAIVHQPRVFNGLISTIAFVDTQASTFVVPSVDYLIRVTDASPAASVSTANGDTSPLAIGVAGVHLIDKQGKEHYFEVHDVTVLPQCDRVLYSWPTMSQVGVKHPVENGYIVMPNGGQVPVGPGLTVEIAFGPPPSHAVAHPATVSASRSSDHEGAPLSAKASAGRGSSSSASVPQSLLWQRLGFPSEHAWRHSREVLADHGLPDSVSLRFDFGVVDAVARARARALPFHKLRDPSELPAPGAVLYLDFAGPMVNSYPHKFGYYCGVVDAGSGFSRLFACHGPTKEVAKRAMETMLADMSALMGLTHNLKPQFAVTDQGSAFMSKYFSDFLAESQVRHWPSTTYTPQQNAYVERMWGTRFSMARALLAHANLGPSWHPWALQTANWILNRLPQPSRGNLSPYYILSRAPASVAYLRTFGCLVRVLVPLARRDGDRHFADRGRLGICLGPSENSPGTCVYMPSTRTFVVSREVLFYEDTLPGVKGVDAAWRELHASHGDEGAAGHALPSPSSVSPSLPHAPPPLPPPSTTSSPPSDSQPAASPPPSTLPATEPSSSARPAVVPPSPSFDVAPTAPEPDPEYGFDTSAGQQRGKHFQRELGPHPVKRERKQVAPHNVSSFKGKSYTAQFIDPTSVDQQGAVYNCTLLEDLTDAGHPVFVYEGNVGGLSAYKAIQTSVATDLGDIPIPRGYRQAVDGRWAPYWREAIAKELNGLMTRGTWHYVYFDELPEGTNLMGCHMIFTVKRLSSGAIEKFKCRLVANGNTQKAGVDFDRIFSTVVKITTIRVVLAIAAARDYNLTSIDVQQAFLQGKLDEDLYMQMPPGLPSRSSDGRRIVCKLDRSLYGLKQAGRVWWQLLTSFLLDWGFKQSAIDVCLYTYTSPTGSILWLLVWVDDTIIVDDDEALRERFVADLGKRFPIEDKHELEWILGVKVARCRKTNSLSLSQELYVRDLCKRHASLLDGLTKRFDSPADPKAPLSPEQSPEVNSDEWVRMQRHRADYMALVGAFLWLANVSFPEISFISSQLARYVNNPGAPHYNAAIRVLLYLKNNSTRKLQFQPISTRPLRVFVDSDWAVKFSVSGAVFEVMGCAVHWFSKVQRSVSMSSTEAEWFAAMVAAREGMYFRDLLTELGIPLLGATALRSDNKSVKDLSLDSVAFKKTKHILRAAHFLRDLCDRQFYQVIWIAGTQNPADLFTKVHDLSTFRAYVALLDRLDGIE